MKDKNGFAFLTVLLSIGSISVLLATYHLGRFQQYQDAAASLLAPNNAYVDNDMWDATAIGPSSAGRDPGMLAATSPAKISKGSDVGPSTAASNFPGMRGRDGQAPSAGDISARGIGHEPHNYAETYIDKHIYPPWPGYSERARNTIDEDKITEGELAARLSRAIDRHEKCRRHWPHLERLEAAQEIRVRDARNNLEVANRGIERARKELIDAENLVMAARQVCLIDT